MRRKPGVSIKAEPFRPAVSQSDDRAMQLTAAYFAVFATALTTQVRKYFDFEETITAVIIFFFY
jgi:hypothetical protein